MFDYIVVGAGFAGSVIAERLATQLDKKVLIIEKRNHIGGNCYDYYDEHGILVHKYGPHLFHTSNKRVFSYLSQFTKWNEYNHKVLAYVNGKAVPIPFNINSINKVFPRLHADTLIQKLIKFYGYGAKVPVLEIRNSEDSDLKALADFIYENVFLNYTTKQWGCAPEEISPEVTARVPIVVSMDDRYFQDKYQVIPKFGYTKMFENILDHPNIKILLNADFREIVKIDDNLKSVKIFDMDFSGKLFFTGMIDELFNFRFGELPYRSLQFEIENVKVDSYQDVATVNFPNNYDFTRITEFKKISQQDVPGSTIVREYPQDFNKSIEGKNVPYYPFFKEENIERYNTYKEYASRYDSLVLVGRLAEYRYYDMDDIVERALDVFEELFYD